MFLQQHYGSRLEDPHLPFWYALFIREARGQNNEDKMEVF